MRETYQNELITLFGYETDRGRASVLWHSPHYFHTPGGQSAKPLDERYSDWMSTTRPLQKEKLLDGMWKKIADHGYTFVVRFLPDGTFIEHSVASENGVAHGTWTQIGPVTRTWLEQMEAGERVHSRRFIPKECALSVGSRTTMSQCLLSAIRPRSSLIASVWGSIKRLP